MRHQLEYRAENEVMFYQKIAHNENEQNFCKIHIFIIGYMDLSRAAVNQILITRPNYGFGATFLVVSFYAMNF